MPSDPIPEQVYRDAWGASADAQAGHPIALPAAERNRYADMCMGAGHRAAVESAYRAGYGQGRDDGAAGVPTSGGDPQ